jgi:SAM-dependent methyltransferase
VGFRSIVGSVPGLEAPIRRVQVLVNTIRHSGGVFPRTCPICDYRGRFGAFGDPPRWDAMCKRCGSLERHRLLKLYLDRSSGAVRGDVIHFAPEPTVAKMLRNTGCNYRSADLFQTADLKLNLEKIELPDSSVDVFVASHVLEHVDDRAALSELRRCLRPGGKALLMVPIIEGWTKSYESPAVTSASARKLHFGQSDHVRYYGRDVRNRIRRAGFDFDEFSVSPEDSLTYSIERGDCIFIAHRPKT